MRKTITILFLLCIAGVLFAQDNFKQGYIIKNEGDTIKGWVDFRTVKINNQQCRFRLTENGDVITYLPGEIFGYRFLNEGKYYITKDIEIEGLKEKVFLEYLLSGILDLYLYEGTGIISYFFEDESGQVFPVAKTFNKGNIQKTEDGRMYNQEDLKYIGMLRYVFKDCEPVVEKVGKNSYKEENMMKLTKEFHDLMCTTGEECIVFEGKQDKNYINVKFAPYVGWSSLSYAYLVGVKIKGSDISSIVLGGEVNLVTPRWNKNMSAVIDFSVIRVKNNFPLEGYLDPMIRMKCWMLDAKIGMRYQFDISKRFKPTVDGGLLSSYIINSSSNKVGGMDMKKEWGNMDCLTIGYSFGIGLNVMTTKDQYFFVRADYRGRAQAYYDIKGFRVCAGYTF